MPHPIFDQDESAPAPVLGIPTAPHTVHAVWCAFAADLQVVRILLLKNELRQLVYADIYFVVNSMSLQ